MSGGKTNSGTQGKETSSLVLLTNHFPYGLYESFLENELPVLANRFTKVIIICRDVTSTGERALHGASVHRINPVSSPGEKIATVWLCMTNCRSIWRCVKNEMNWLKSRQRKMNSFIFDDLVHTLVKALQTARQVRKIMASEGVHENAILYSYWLSSSALALTFISSKRRGIKSISRAHGGDVYEYRNENKYLPFRRTLIHQLDRIFAISDDAAAHLRRQADEADASKVHVMRLGTKAAGSAPARSGRRFTVVSCAFLIPVKRVHLLIDALQQIDRFDIHWIHIGSGPLADELNAHAKKRLGSKTNITYQFSGSRTNAELMQFYRDTYVDVFVNTSSAEGIPVTIMEAQSFGIPVVAPEVGGVSEIVTERTGRLFHVDASPLIIGQLICEILELAPADAKAMRQAAFQNWNTRYNADRNFSTFVDEIQKL
jgi:glycosyltransferase involved in cell wall biosynthesis